MFNLESAIADWRQQMVAGGIQTPVPLEELEGHLREEIERLKRSGLSELEAFNSAVQRIGQAYEIGTEFGKVDIARGVDHWKWVEVALLSFSSLFPLMIGHQLLHMRAETPGTKISGLVAALTFALLAWSSQFGHRIFPVVRVKQTRIVIRIFSIVAAGLWWSAFLFLIVPRFEFTPGQLVLAFLWGFLVPGGAWIGFTLGIETAARKHQMIHS